MFYLKYRPKTISELDNSLVKEKIINILQSENLPHAFLLIGSKGMGKTSTARIFAKALNCKKNKFANSKLSNYEPCNNCENCIMVDAGNCPDVIEQDGASNRGIDEIRTIIKESMYLPMTGKYRVYIIDEAHMITTEAFNALLKTLEEPPETAIFLLATTNEEKLPKTIVSRCIRVPFEKATKSDVFSMLERIAKSEKITLSLPLKELIFNSCENSFRDATKILEELFVQKKLSYDEAKKYLGVSLWGEFLEILQAKNLEKSIEFLDNFEQEGGDFKKLIEESLLILQKELVNKNTNQQVKYLKLNNKDISFLIKLLHEAYSTMKISPIMALPLQVAVMEFHLSE